MTPNADTSDDELTDAVSRQMDGIEARAEWTRHLWGSA